MTDPARVAPSYVGTAGWRVPAPSRDRFPAGASLLERYAGAFPAVEVNSSFYRPHRPGTYARWAASTPAAFRFAVKIPKAITHEARLAGPAVPALLDAFLAECTSLGDRIGPLLVQLPPKLAFDAPAAGAFLAALRARHAGTVVAEPRHPTWFGAEAERLLTEFAVARVAADPAPVPAAAEPAAWDGLVYYRLHGSPKMYYSNYEDAYLDAVADRLARHAAAGVPAWCIFDNTALDAATANGLDVLERLGSGSGSAGRERS